MHVDSRQPVPTDRTDRPRQPDPTDQPDQPDRTDRAIGPGRPAHRLPDWADTRAILLIATAAVLLALFWWWSGRAENGTIVASPDPRPNTEVSTTSNSGSETGATPTSMAQDTTLQPLDPDNRAEVTVDVRGGVRNRGVHVLPTGSRVIDAIDAAGGLRSGRTYGKLNLAEVLIDGQQISVGRDTDPNGPAPPVSTRALPPDSGAPIDLNTATPVQLESLPGVGPVLADRIVGWREEHGRFTTVDDLLDVSGIGDKVLAGLRDSASV